MRQQLMYQAGPLGCQTRKHFFEMSVRVVPVELGALNQAHHSGTTLSRPKRTDCSPAPTLVVSAPLRLRPNRDGQAQCGQSAGLPH